MSTPHIKLGVRVLALVGIELTSWLLTQMILAQYHWSSPVAELVRTAIRLHTLTFDWYLFRGLILAQRLPCAPGRSRRVAASMLLMLCAALLMPHPALSAPLSVLFAATGIVVGIKEEVLFRGIVQRLLQRPLGGLVAVFATSALFTLWHTGVVPLGPKVLAEIFLASCVLGLVYLRTASLRAVIALHAGYDALYVLVPSLGPDRRAYWPLLPLATAAMLLVSSGRFGRRRSAGLCSRASEPAPECRPGSPAAEPLVRSSGNATALAGRGANGRAWSAPVRTIRPT